LQRNTLSTICALTLLIGELAYSHTIRYVDDDAAPNGNGKTWATAYNDLQTALADSEADEIHVAEGVYRPGTHRTDSFHIRDGLTIRGGFGGPSVLSGDLADNDPQIGENAYHVLTISGNEVCLTNLTIAAGNANSFDLDGYGAGVHCNGYSVLIVNCDFIRNRSHHGGGLFVQLGGAIVIGSRFSGDHLASSGSSGGGINAGASWLIVDSCEFTDMDKENGGAIYVVGGRAMIRRSQFVGNQASTGGAVLAVASTLAIGGCEFVGNHSTLFLFGGGGAICATNAAEVSVWGSSFIGNIGQGLGTIASVAAASDGSEIQASGCLFDGNTVPTAIADPTSMITGVPSR
jgi:hypothetical protein